MRVLSLAPDQASSLADRLAAFDSLRGIPRAELEWLVAHGEYRAYDAGEVLVRTDQEARDLVVQLSGRIVVYFGHGAGNRHVAASRAGSITGLLPFSRLKRPPADVLVEEPTELLAIDVDQFPALIRECPKLTESLVHNLLDRARRFAAADWQDEKVMSLGRLAAGLAHELNNPATAASSGARRLTRAIQEVGAAAHEVGMSALSPEQRARVTTVVRGCEQTDRSVASLSPIERADLEERLAVWLEAHGVDTEWAPMLADGGVGEATLEQLAEVLEGAPLAAALRWIAAASTAAIVAGDVERATRRIHDLVTAVRGFTHMDRAPVREPTDVVKGLEDTRAILRAKAKAKAVTVRVEAPPDLPKVTAVAPDLNQVWANLIENAIDAAREGGEVVVRAAVDNGTLDVRVVDDGPGIPPEIQPRIFDPFFTTKPVGEGTGLGLDIVRRNVHNHHGDVNFETRPGRTEFRVRMPVG